MDKLPDQPWIHQARLALRKTSLSDFDQERANLELARSGIVGVQSVEGKAN
ncbi:MAG: hypothetical protein AAGC96_16470 [Pseudomonadota bacterium]